jgi:hypothetical protein
MNDEDDEDLPVFGDNLKDLMNAGGSYPIAV